MSKYKYDWEEFSLDKLPADSIDRYTLDFVPRDSYVLELGCATGFHSQFLQEVKGCTVVGAEIDKRSAKLASTVIDTVITGNLDDAKTWGKIKSHSPFDVVLASNVLEHLVDPWTAMEQAHKVLKRGGIFVVAIPNIGFWRARLKILRGKWEYEDYGIFDRTHTKFFTINSMREDLEYAGFKVRDEKYDPAGGAKWFTPLLKKFPNAYAHQVVYKAVKTKG